MIQAHSWYLIAEPKGAPPMGHVGIFYGKKHPDVLVPPLHTVHQLNPLLSLVAYALLV